MRRACSDSVAVVTGAGGDIGRAVALRLARLGMDVGVNDIDADRAQATVKLLQEQSLRAFALPGDMSSEGDVSRMFALLENSKSGVDVLVTQAGIVAMAHETRAPDELSEEDWRSRLANDETFAYGCYLSIEDFERIFANNFTSTLLCCEHAIPLMRAAGGGRIITMTAAGGGISSHFSPAYAMAKGGVVGLTRSLAKRCLEHGILVNCISQGFTDGGIWRQAPQLFPELFERDWNVIEHEGQRHVLATAENNLPLQRLGSPEEIAATVAFLCSGEVDYFVGQTFNLSGGVLIP